MKRNRSLNETNNFLKTPFKKEFDPEEIDAYLGRRNEGINFLTEKSVQGIDETIAATQNDELNYSTENIETTNEIITEQYKNVKNILNDTSFRSSNDSTYKRIDWLVGVDQEFNESNKNIIDDKYTNTVNDTSIYIILGGILITIVIALIIAIYIYCKYQNKFKCRKQRKYELAHNNTYIKRDAESSNVNCEEIIDGFKC